MCEMVPRSLSTRDAGCQYMVHYEGSVEIPMTVPKGNWMMFCNLKTCATFIREYLALPLSIHFKL